MKKSTTLILVGVAGPLLFAFVVAGAMMVAIAINTLGAAGEILKDAGDHVAVQTELKLEHEKWRSFKRHCQNEYPELKERLANYDRAIGSVKHDLRTYETYGVNPLPLAEFARNKAWRNELMGLDN